MAPPFFAGSEGNHKPAVYSRKEGESREKTIRITVGDRL